MSIAVHPLSKWSAEKFVQTIIQDKHIRRPNDPRSTLRRCFTVNSMNKTAFDVATPSRLLLPRDVLKIVVVWYKVIELASRSNHWYITTGEWVTQGVIKAHATDTAFWKKRAVSPATSSAPGSRVPPPTPSKKQVFDFTRKGSRPGQGNAAKGKPQIKQNKGSLSTTGDMRTGPIVTMVKDPVGGVCVPPKAWAKPGQTYYDENGRGIIVIPVKGSGGASMKTLKAVAKAGRAHTILHEIIHAGLAEKRNQWTGHCFDAFFKLDKFFQTGSTRQTCCDEIRKLPRTGNTKRDLRRHGCAASKPRISTDPLDLFKN